MSKHSANAAKSVVLVFVLSLVTSLISFFCEMVYANYFGVSAETDAFTIASQIPVILFSVVTSSVSTTVIPLYSKIKHNDGIERAQQFASRFLTLLAVVSIALVSICELLAPLIVKLFAPGAEQITFDYAVRFIRITFPTIIFTGLMSICMGVIQVHKRFGKSSVLSIVRQIVYIAFIISLHRHVGIYAAVLGLLISSIVEFIMALAFTSREIKLSLNFHFKDSNIIEAFKMSVPIFAGIGAAEINRLVDKIVVSFMESGSISMLNYASKLSGAFTSLIIGAISTVMFPYFAEKVSQNDKKGLSETFFLTLNTYLFLTIPIIAGGIILRQELVEIAFLRGAFTKENATAVAVLFAGYLFSMLFSALRQTSTKLFYANRDTKTPMINTLIGIGLNIVLNIVLGYYFGAAGIVYATVASTALISILLLISAKKYIYFTMWRGFFAVLLKVLICVFGMTVALLLAKPLFDGINNILSALILVLIGIVSYGILILLLAKKEVKEIIRVAKK